MTNFQLADLQYMASCQEGAVIYYSDKHTNDKNSTVICSLALYLMDINVFTLIYQDPSNLLIFGH